MVFDCEREIRDIWIMDVDGSNQTNLTKSEPANALPVGNSGAVFSPDGSKIIFNSNRDANYEIYMMEIDGNNQINLTRNQAPDYDAIIQPVSI